MSKITFLSLVFASGVIIGGVKTPDIIAYSKAVYSETLKADHNSNEAETQKKAKPLPKRLRKSVRIV